MTTEVVKIENKAYLISKIENTGKGFKISFRTYDVANECGGFETTVIVANAAIALAKAFTGSKNEIKATAGVFGAEIVKMTVNNIVSEKFRFQNVKSQIA